MMRSDDTAGTPTPSQVEARKAHLARLQRIAAAAVPQKPPPQKSFGVFPASRPAARASLPARGADPGKLWSKPTPVKRTPGKQRFERPAGWMGGNCGRIQAEVCDFYGVSLDEMLCERRFPRISRPRQIAMFLCVELTSLSLINLAGRFHRDHTTLLGALKKIRGLLLWDRELQDEIAELRRRCADEVPA